MEKIKILVAEDESVAQKIYEKGLLEEVFERRIVGNGESALEVYLAWKPDIVILDFRMPKMTGYSVLKQIRELYKDTTTIIIMATAISDKEEVMACVKLGIQGYIVKPVKMVTISEKILGYFQKFYPEKGKAALEKVKDSKKKMIAEERQRAIEAQKAKTKTENKPPPQNAEAEVPKQKPT